MGRVPYWRLSSFYFLYFSTLGGFLPYWSLYLQDNNFSAEQIGELIAILTGTKIISANMWGWIADHTGKSVRIIRVTALFSMLAFIGFFFAPSYWWFALVSFVFSFFWNAGLPQFEAVTLSHLNTDIHRYSSIRIWGSIGFIFASVGIGAIVDRFGISQLLILLVTLFSCIWIVSLMVPYANVSHQHDKHADFFQVLRAPGVIGFLVVCMLIQVSHGPYYVFYSIYLEENGYSSTQIGQLWSLGVVAEIILFLFVYRLLKLFTLRQILLTSIFLGMLRWVIIAWDVNNPWLLMTAQLLHAATFGSAHVAAIHLIHRYFSGSLQGRGQALYSSISFGLGGVIGSYCSGILWASKGPVFVFLIASVTSAVALIIAWAWVAKIEDSSSSQYKTSASTRA